MPYVSSMYLSCFIRLLRNNRICAVCHECKQNEPTAYPGAQHVTSDSNESDSPHSVLSDGTILLMLFSAVKIHVLFIVSEK